MVRERPEPQTRRDEMSNTYTQPGIVGLPAAPGECAELREEVERLREVGAEMLAALEIAERNVAGVLCDICSSAIAKAKEAGL